MSTLAVDSITDAVGSGAPAFPNGVSGNIVSTGALTATGIYLGGTGSANLLDDYEEGATSVQLRGSTEPATLLTATMYWEKINDRVSFQLGFESADTTGYAGSVTISGLPFVNTYDARAVLSVGAYGGVTWSDTLFAYIGKSGGTTIELMDIRSGTTWVSANHTGGADTYIWVTGTYKN